MAVREPEGALPALADDGATEIGPLPVPVPSDATLARKLLLRSKLKEAKDRMARLAECGAGSFNSRLRLRIEDELRLAESVEARAKKRKAAKLNVSSNAFSALGGDSTDEE